MLEATMLLVVLLVPIAVAVARSRGTTVSDFVFNSNRSSVPQTVASIVGGNVGIGTFIAIFLFSEASPLIGISLAVSYTAGLLLCALLAPWVHRASRSRDAFGLIDFIVVTHRVDNPAFIWLPVAMVFILRTVVQLMALSAILASAFNQPFAEALAAAALLSGIYVVIGGYKAATETDVFQVSVIVMAMCLAFLGLSLDLEQERDYLDLGPYRPVLLVGVFLFIPLSPILAVDNWQRIATSRSPAVARQSYFVAALICGAIYATIVLAALDTASAPDVLETFRQLMPDGMPWLADMMFAACIMSSIDTFVMPLVTSFARRGASLLALRLLVIAIFVVIKWSGAGAWRYIVGHYRGLQHPDRLPARRRRSASAQEPLGARGNRVARTRRHRDPYPVDCRYQLCRSCRLFVQRGHLRFFFHLRDRKSASLI